MTAQIVILDSFAVDQGELDWSRLAAMGSLTFHPRTRPEDVVDRAQGAEIVLTNKVVLDGPVLGALPKLAYVGVLATGTNVVDIPLCEARKIAVTNVPAYAAASVTQLTFAMILHFTQGVHRHADAVKRGAWATSPDFSFFVQPLVELENKTLVILGGGTIGTRVAHVAQAFGMRVIFAAVPGSKGAPRMPLDEALPEADVVSLHCPLTESTRHLVNEAFLQKMKPGALLINTGRGPLIAEDALVAALCTGRLGGVGLDVLSVEPPPQGHPLLDPKAPYADRVIVTPHIGWGTIEARQRLRDIATENVAAFLAGRRQNRIDRE